MQLFYPYILLITGFISHGTAENNFNFQQNDYNMEFERADAIRHNKRALNVFQVRTFKYNRTCTAVNITFEANVDAGHDVEVIVQAYAFLSNEYREFPLRFEVNLCDAFRKNYAGLREIGKCGNITSCPIMKGILHRVCNFVPDANQLPPLIPNGRYMVELQGLLKGEEVFVLRAYGRVFRPVPILGK